MNEIKQDEGLGRVCMLKPILAGQEGEGSTQESDSNSGVNQSDEEMPALGEMGEAFTQQEQQVQSHWGENDLGMHGEGNKARRAEQTKVTTDEAAEARLASQAEEEILNVKKVKSFSHVQLLWAHGL